VPKPARSGTGCEALVPKLVSKEGQGFVKVLLSELEGAIDRASEKSLSAQETPAVAVDGEPTEPA
jgi:hypothetical protein